MVAFSAHSGVRGGEGYPDCSSGAQERKDRGISRSNKAESNLRGAKIEDVRWLSMAEGLGSCLAEGAHVIDRIKYKDYFGK